MLASFFFFVSALRVFLQRSVRVRVLCASASRGADASIVTVERNREIDASRRDDAMWTTREIDGVARALREVADALAEASSEAKSRDARRARGDDDEADGPALGAVRGATLAGNCAVRIFVPRLR